MTTNTKDAVLALADRLANTAATYMRQDVADASVMLRRLAPLLEAPGDLRETLAEALWRAETSGIGAAAAIRDRERWADQSKTTRERWLRFASAILPLIRARIAQAEQAATERAAAWHDAEADRCEAQIKDCIARDRPDCDPGIFVVRDTHHESAAAIRARNTEEDRSDG